MDKKIFTTFQSARLCKVAHSTVINWVNEGKLSAYTTPGGHRRIQEDDLLLFLKKYKLPVPADMTEKKRKRILLVDDDRLTVEVIARAVKKTGLFDEIDTAYDGFTAGKKISSTIPEIVVLDLFLPGMDGFEICRAIKEDPSTKNIRIIAITSFDTEENRKKIKKCGADDYLVKPFKNGELLDRLRILVEK